MPRHDIGPAGQSVRDRKIITVSVFKSTFADLYRYHIVGDAGLRVCELIFGYLLNLSVEV